MASASFSHPLPTSTLSHVSWALQKGVNAVRSGQVYILAPAALAAYTAYRSLGHFKTAAFGKDALSYRKKVFIESTHNSSLTSRVSRFVLGSISFQDRMKEASYGVGYLAISAFLLYGLHAYTQKENEIQFMGDPKMSAGEKEMFPEAHQYQVTQQALNFYDQNEEFMNRTLTSPADPRSERTALKVADHIFKPSQTPAREYLSQGWSNLCSYLPSSISGSSVCEASSAPTVAEMTAEELDRAYENAKVLIEQQAKTDYEGKSASVIRSACETVFNWIPGHNLTETRCSALEHSIHPEVTDEKVLSLSRLEKFYEILKTRVATPGANVIGKIIQIAQSSPVDPTAEDATAQLSNVLGNMKGLDSNFPTDYYTFNFEHTPYYRKAASTLFGLPEDFTHAQFRKAYRVFSRVAHPDKFANKDEATFIQTILNNFNEIFKWNELYSDEYGKADIVSFSSFPSPVKVIQDLAASIMNWYQAPMVTLA